MLRAGDSVFPSWPPALLIVAIAVAFFNETRLSSDKKNEMTIGSIAEPSMLNPIQQADSAASEVGGMIFNGLLKYNADLEITTDLAKTFALSQHTTIFFDDPKAVPGAWGSSSSCVDAGRTGNSPMCGRMVPRWY